MAETDTFASFFHALADAACGAILPSFRAEMHVEDKTDGAAEFDPVTVADRAGEQAMRALIQDRFPDHGIIGEEFENLNVDADYVWVLDPIDGTRAFISGLPTWGVLIGLKKEGAAHMGMMVQPFTRERYFGDGQSAHYFGPDGTRKLRARLCPALAQATLATTSPALFDPAERALYDPIEKAARLTRYGTDCYAYCMVASGLVDVVVESGLKTFDIAALIPIVTGAGGRVTSWTGASAVDGGRILACGDPKLHEMMLTHLAGV